MSLLAAVFTGLTIAAAVLGAYWATTRRRTAPVMPAGPVRMGWRYCPECLRVEAAVMHLDGTATCNRPGCGTHIPGTTEVTP